MRDRLDEPFSATVRAIGEGKIAHVTLPDRSKAIPLPGTTYLDRRTHLCFYPPVLLVAWTTWNSSLVSCIRTLLLQTPLFSQAVLAPANVSTDHINDFVLHVLPNPLHTQLSATHQRLVCYQINDCDLLPNPLRAQLSANRRTRDRD